MFGKFSMALAAGLIMAGTALADPIEGNWKTHPAPRRRSPAVAAAFPSR